MPTAFFASRPSPLWIHPWLRLTAASGNGWPRERRASCKDSEGIEHALEVAARTLKAAVGRRLNPSRLGTRWVCDSTAVCKDDGPFGKSPSAIGYPVARYLA